MRIGLFIPNWIGDAVMVTPALRALRRKFSGGEKLIGIMRPYVRPVYDGTSWLDEIWLYDADEAGVMSRPELVERMRRAELNAVVLFTNSLGSALLAWRGRARERIGYAREFRSPFLTRRLEPLKRGWKFVPFPAVDSYLELAYAAGCNIEPPVLELATTKHDEEAADTVWRDCGFSPDRPIVLLNSSGAYGAAKLWPDEYFAELAGRIVRRLGASALFLAGPSDRDRIDAIVRSVSHPDVHSMGDRELSIGLSKACVRRSSLLVTTDSGPRHFAAAFGVPVVSLFGPTHIAWSDTHYAKEIFLQIKVDCGPCQKRVCPLGHHKCMRDLTIDQVFREVENQIKGK